MPVFISIGQWFDTSHLSKSDGDVLRGLYLSGGGVYSSLSG